MIDEVTSLRAELASNHKLLELMQDALEVIATEDALVKANEIFSVDAFRRCQTIARAALEKVKEI